MRPSNSTPGCSAKVSFLWVDLVSVDSQVRGSLGSVSAKGGLQPEFWFHLGEASTCAARENEEVLLNHMTILALRGASLKLI